MYTIPPDQTEDMFEPYNALNFRKRAGLYLVAAVFSEEGGDVVAREFLGPVLVGRGDVVGFAAPRVDVVPPEIDSRRRVTAVEIVGKLSTSLIIVGGVSNSKRAVVLGDNVRFHVTHSRFHEGACNGVVWGVGNLIASKEAQGICVVGQRVNDRGVTGVQFRIPLGCITVDGCCRLTQIGDDVDPSVRKSVHTLRVVLGGVDGVCSDSVGLQLQEVGNVSCTRRGVGQRVCVRIGAGGSRSGAISSEVLCNTLARAFGIGCLCV